jgi:hypothetical protein
VKLTDESEFSMKTNTCIRATEKSTNVWKNSDRLKLPVMTRDLNGHGFAHLSVMVEYMSFIGLALFITLLNLCLTRERVCKDG